MPQMACSSIEYFSQEDKKMKKIKRILVLCLVAAMFLGIMAIPAGAVFSVQNAEDYVEQLYTGLLGRASDEAGKLLYVNKLYSQGVSAGTVAQQFVSSAEFRGRQLNNDQYVETLYQGLLGRAADAAGKAGFLNAMDCGQSRTWVFQQILASAEFKSHCENDFNMYVGNYSTDANVPNVTPTNVNTAEARPFVEQLYVALLGRDPASLASDAGVNHWVDMLFYKKLNAAGVATAIASSAEFNSKSYTNSEFITRCYQGLLGRNPDVAGYTAFVNALNSGKTRSWVFSSICASSEFQNRVAFSSGYANVTPGISNAGSTGSVSGGAVNAQMATDYVCRLYRYILNTEIDPNDANVQGWVSKLVNRQLSAPGVAAAIAASPQAKGIARTREQYVECLYGALLGRASDPEGLGGFVAALRSGYSRSWVFAKIVQSTEFQKQSLFSDMNVVPGTINYTAYDMG